MIPHGDNIPELFKRDGQNWLDGSKRCYKCESFQGNMPMTGRCPLTGRENIVTGDFCRGDWCAKFTLKNEIAGLEVN